MFERLLGIEMKRDQYVQGGAFCDTVVELTDEATLATMWDSPDAMPSLPEIEEPRLWLARIGDVPKRPSEPDSARRQILHPDR